MGLGNLEREYPVLREDRRHRESKNKNIKSLIILGVVVIGITIKIITN